MKFPGWLGWLLVLVVIYQQVRLMNLTRTLGHLKGVLAGKLPRTRGELDQWYSAGRLSRDEYEQAKAQVEG